MNDEALSQPLGDFLAKKLKNMHTPAKMSWPHSCMEWKGLPTHLGGTHVMATHTQAWIATSQLSPRGSA